MVSLRTLLRLNSNCPTTPKNYFYNILKQNLGSFSRLKDIFSDPNFALDPLCPEHQRTLSNFLEIYRLIKIHQPDKSNTP